jgi:hypothetical protein
MENFNVSASRESRGGRNILDRILDTPHLERVVPQLQPEVLHRVIQSCGLEDCGELILLATPEQLTRILDLDLWRSAKPSMDEQFDAERFGLWLEVLAESGASVAAQKLAEIDADLVIVGLAQHARVFDCALVTPYRTTDGIELTAIRGLDDQVASEVGGYRLVAKRPDSWEAIVAILISLDAEHPDFFHQVMRGCRALSNAGRELDGLHDSLEENQQFIFDRALDRESRRDEQGYVTPAQARAFLQMSRQIQLGSDTRPPDNPVARAFFRTLEETKAEPPSKPAAASADPPDATVALVDVLLEAGIIAQPYRALLNASQEDRSSLRRIRTHMQVVFDRDQAAYTRRSEELTYLANTLMSGCALQGRPFTTQEASDAASAICNLGLENWPPQWIPAKSFPDDFLVDHDLVTVFQVGWTVLHKNVVMYVAERLLTVLADLRCDDYDIQTGLDTLRSELSKHSGAGVPWRARDTLEVITILDMPAWAALLGLIDEYPVLHAVLSASRNPRTLSVSATAFEFISENSHIAIIREFMQSLPETLAG